MPHPPTFKKEHGALGKADPNLCAKCHGNATTFCDECHHGTAMKVPYDTAQTVENVPPDHRDPGRSVRVLRVPQPDLLCELPRERSRQGQAVASEI